MSAFFDLKIDKYLHRMEAGNDNPSTEGLYAAEIHFGWKLLEWQNGGWRHPSGCRWTAGDPFQWVGPLPACKGAKPKMGFDL